MDKMFLHAVIYKKPNCVKCRLTDMKIGIDHVTKPITQDKIDYMHSKNWYSAPLVRVYAGNDLVDEWHDFQIDKIKKYQKGK